MATSGSASSDTALACFSLDVQPLLFVVLATVFERGMSRRAAAAGIASVAVCAYAYWAIVTGFVSY